MKYLRITGSKTDEDEIVVESSRLMDLSAHEITLRNDGILKNKAVFLPTFIAGERVKEWIIARDKVGVFCAIPLKK